jgi:hypothetical protein
MMLFEEDMIGQLRECQTTMTFPHFDDERSEK